MSYFDWLKQALARVDALLLANAEPGTPDGDELEALIDQIERYENEEDTFVQ